MENDKRSDQLPGGRNDESLRSRDVYSGPLIIAKRDCVDPEGVYDSKTCSPYDRSGIIQPHVDFKRTDTASADNKRSPDSAREWNADQSKLKQTQPNDSGSYNPAQKFPPEDYSDRLDDKHPGSSQSASTWLKDYEFRLPQSLANPVKPSTIRRENQYRNEHTELGLEPRKQFALNIGLIASVSVGGICVLIALTCVIYRCMRRDEGSYNVDENLAYTGESHSMLGSSGPGTRVARKRDGDMQMSVLRHTPDATGHTTQTMHGNDAGPMKSALMVTFNDNCKDAFTGPGTLGAQPATSADMVSSKQELLSSPSIQSADNSVKRSRLVKIEQPFDRRTLRSTAKSKHCKDVTDSQEWYV
ncbi:unnamed protein product [Echinostoma caproni]|uniref:4.1m domain-containing protein n=1 Tax=Echinostoma caproni TaxID=27848 RepID=A0A183B3B5_9TREM|nr:unnamed protein product [Echinostoma caproni]